MTKTKAVLASIAILATLLVGGATLAVAQESGNSDAQTEAPSDPGTTEEPQTRNLKNCPDKQASDHAADEATPSSV